jgi:hypothetical protein
MPVQGPEGSRRMTLPEFLVSRYMKVVRLSEPYAPAAFTHPQEIFLIIISVRGSRSQGHSDTIGNRTRDLPACSVVAQPTALPHAPPPPPPPPPPLPPPRSCYLRLQFLTLMIFRSSTDSGHLNLGFSTRQVPSGLRTVSFQQGSSSCILKGCPSHLNVPIFTTLTMSSSSYSVQS